MDKSYGVGIDLVAHIIRRFVEEQLRRSSPEDFIASLNASNVSKLPNEFFVDIAKAFKALDGSLGVDVIVAPRGAFVEASSVSKSCVTCTSIGGLVELHEIVATRIAKAALADVNNTQIAEALDEDPSEPEFTTGQISEIRDRVRELSTTSSVRQIRK